MFFVFMFSISATQKDIYNDIFINGNVAGWEGEYVTEHCTIL